MRQQLYLNRATVCVALELTTRRQLEAIRVQAVKGARGAAIGDFLVIDRDGESAVQSADSFHASWARPDALLSPEHARLFYIVEDAEHADSAELATKANSGTVQPASPRKRHSSSTGRCPDCGKKGETAGHQDCPYPQNH